MSHHRLPLAASLVCLCACTGDISGNSPADPGPIGPAVPRAPTPSAPGTLGSVAAPPSASPPLPTSPMGPVSTCKTRDPGLAPLRRLTREEYDNTVRDLLGDTSRPSLDFPPDEETLGFVSTADSAGVTPLGVEQYLRAAEGVAERAVRTLDKIFACDHAKDGADACGRRFVDTLGKRAWRRPLTPTEAANMLRVFTWGKVNGDYSMAIRLTLETLLGSPRFLYRVEHPAAARTPEGFAVVDPWELASRLSYTLWATMPDDTLFAAAEAGLLATKEQVTAQARRMLADPRARRTVARFFADWLDLEKIDTLDKDKAVYPAFAPELRTAFRTETERFLDHVVFGGDGTIASLLTAPYTFVNARLAALYGVKAPAAGAFERVELDPAVRAGLLTQGGLLAAQSLANQTSPIHRGLFVREHLLCQTPPPPPDNVEVKPPDLDPKLTTRERFARHSTDPACRGCHQLMDPIGLGFESFDGIGRHRSTENGRPVDSTGELFSTDVDGPFSGPISLARKLAGSVQVQDCMLLQWFRFGYGRGETPEDRCALEALGGALGGARGDLKALFLALTATDTFLYKRPSASVGGAP